MDTGRDAEANVRILLIDDNPAIHEDFRKVLAQDGGDDGVVADLEAALFDDAPAPARSRGPAFELDSALQGLDAVELVRKSLAEKRPYALAFVDVRMPPGLDGVETIARMWEVDPDLQAVICTAFSDYSWSEMIARLGQSDRLLILKKPFDSIEVQQLAAALTEKWNVTRRERQRLVEVQRAEQEARAYAASLETVNRALETTLATAEAASKAKSEFLLRMTHEVLGPMTGLLNTAERAGAIGVPGEDWLSQVETLCRDEGQLRTMLADILDLCELEAEGLDLERARCDPQALVREVVESLRERAGARRVELRLELVGELPDVVLADQPRLRRMLAHLVDNALRYTTRGSVRVTAGCDQDERAWRNPMLRFVVADTGQGMTPDQLGRVFEPFGLFARDATGRSRGSGLSLSVTRRLAQCMGGDLLVESTPGQGSTFTLTVAASSPVGAA